MKPRVAFVLFFLLACISCSDNDDISQGLEGTWRLKEVYSDPGDGSGNFVPAETSLEIRFLASGELQSSYKLCGGPDTGQDTAYYDDEMKEIYVSGCYEATHQVFTLRYQMDWPYLEVYYPCIEACVYRFVKID